MSPDSGMRDALEDAIRRAYFAPVTPAVEGEDLEVVEALASASIIANPDRMRHMMGIQEAAWQVVRAASSRTQKPS